ncbi:MAG TPA: tRNA uracil 4-sulfurtransferase ThiI [Longimicrobiales bacterium]|nr:tRNA uracil 4-sulfurtransferase ThiI [Longimicrobiales bacterium]
MTEENGTDERPLVLLRLAGEIAIKSKATRKNFVRRLRHNLRDALDSVGGSWELDDEWSRIFVRAESPDLPTVLPRVFGISSVSPIDAEVPARLDAIVAEGRRLYADLVRGRTYAVRARRSGTHPFASRDIEHALGAALNEAATVDLSNPEVTVLVEVRDARALLFTRRIPGAGGLPLGVEGRALALISGGYDSAVAAWLLAKRGVELDYVFCNLGGDAYERAVLQVAKVLADDWSYGSRPRMHVVDFEAPLRELREKTQPRYWQVALKRLMYRAASRVAEETGAEALITGEAMGQVSSQTLSNLRAIEPAATLPVFRPLLGFDKEEIIERARHIGTAALSERVKEYCAIAPGRPVTAATVEAVDAQDRAMDPAIVEEAVARRRVLDLRALEPVDLVAPYLFTTEIPDDAVVLDCRSEAQYRAWHLPGAQHREEWELLKSYRALDKAPTYVLYCMHGIQSAHLAEKMQRHGYEAYSFRGGVAGLRAWAGG